ncbi:hypothetical protein HYR69_12255 [Candidatus Sumerlaeota bacterium]|nr:hypothetical protein [Candidatus Sumerlaeota bacterium]
MLDTLLNFIAQHDQSHEGFFITIDSLACTGSLLSLGISVTFDMYPDELASKWNIVCDGVQESRIGECYGDCLYIEEMSHPVVRQHTDARRELYFRGKSDDANRLIGLLCRKHREVAGDWIPFTKYLNDCPLHHLLASGSGQLASGPAFLVEAYAGVLRDEAILYNLLPERPSEVAAPLHVLVVGSSFVVAEKFTENRI